MEPYVVPRAYCENEPHAQAVLLSRMFKGEVPAAPIWDDVRTLRGEDFLGSIDVLYGGFPCQDISTAGRGGGLDGKRSGLYWEIHRLAKEIEPPFIFLENVPAIRTRGLDVVVRSLTDLGYDCRWDVVSAAEVGAHHLRKRWFLLAYADGKLLRHESGRECRAFGQGPDVARYDGAEGFMGDANGARLAIRKEQSSRQEFSPSQRASASLADASSRRRDEGDSDAGGGSGDESERPEEWRRSPDRYRWWDVEPDVGRVAHGVPLRGNRLRGLGNAVVPLQAQIAFERLLGYATRR
ncbi:MAG: DNA cytosine methyltransferase [Nitrospirota bacterium]|nr:DNA cytosine methyltransferase [Nitrospirota bacterium]